VDSARAAVRPLTIDRRDATDVGRAARLELVFGTRRGRTVLEHAYAEPPLRVGRCFETSWGLHAILASSAPGVFAGDELQQQTAILAGARVRLTSQSALQVHPGPSSVPAHVVGTYRIEPGGALECEWHPLIPFAAARLRQTIAIDLASGAALAWSDALMAGRDARGERWQFTSLAHELKLQLDNRLIYLERYRLEPERRTLDARWIAGQATYFGTAIAAGTAVDRTEVESLQRDLEAIDGVSAAADCLEPGVALIRLMAASGVPFHNARERVADRLARWLRSSQKR
jgi:urease accessory protein